MSLGAEDVDLLLAGIFDLNRRLERVMHDVYAIRRMLEDDDGEEEEEADH